MALSTQRASASLPSSGESSAPRWKYDVFLSFRGEDTRKGIVSHLYDELQNMGGIKTFKDDKELEIGTAISPSLLTAIEESRSAIVILSPNYASSAWCLGELSEILRCNEENNTKVIPIFYGVDPSHVRHQMGSFAAAFIKHEEKFRQDEDLEKVKGWRAALTKVANLSGLDSNMYGSDRELVKKIAEKVCSIVRPIEIEYTMSTGDFVEFEATKHAIKEVIDALKDDKVTAIGVWGMGGVGKTTMVKHIGAQAQKIGLFHHVIMAVVSQSPELRKIQGTLADLLGLELKKETETGRAATLMKEIIGGNKILIILDDVWERIELSSIGIPSYEELQRCNSKVLITTRRLNVCHSMESQTSIPLHILSEEDSWNLFVKKARKSFEKSTKLYDVARVVAGECAGLPVALIAVARALGDKDLDEWEEAARRLKAAQPANLEDRRDVFKCIKLSYDYLTSDDAKSFFLLCCLFPEDCDIQIEDLLQYGIGKGLVQNVDTIQEARSTTHFVVKYLKASSLLLESEQDGCVRMHDVIRDVAISISLSKDGPRFFVKAGCELKKWPMINALEGYSAISLIRNEICNLPEKLVCSKLQILLLQSNASISEIPETFFQSSNELRVLDLSKTSISLLPPSFSLLANLRALCLDDCKKKIDISMLGKLKKLEILSMRRFPLKEFPKEIGELTHLRKLDVTHARFKTVPSKVLSKLRGLEELYMICNFQDWGTKHEGGFFSLFSGNKFAGFEELTGMPCLNILKVCISDVECLPKNVRFDPNWVMFDISINRRGIERDIFFKRNLSHHHRYRNVTLDITMNTLPDWFINVVTQNAEILEYRECKGLNNILVEYECGRLHQLKYLSILGGCKNMEELMNTRTMFPNKPVLEKLEELYISKAKCMKELCVGDLPPGSLCNLKLLDVICCPGLVNTLLPSSFLQRLQNLEIVECVGMDGMQYVFGSEGLEPEQIVMTKLREIRLSDLGELINISKGPAVSHAMFHNLKILVVQHCKKLKNLFTYDVAQCLLQLEELWVSNCSSLDRVIEASEEAVNKNKISIFPELKNLVLASLPKLTRFYSSTTGNSTIDHIEFPSLAHFHVMGCPKLLTSFSDFHSRNQVQDNIRQRWRYLGTSIKLHNRMSHGLPAEYRPRDKEFLQSFRRYLSVHKNSLQFIESL